ncbi:HD domain-containing protein [Patescibacteria group bacterium]|nr:HD domain-containing protein [Patescibacteria group bacterium]
MEEIIKQLEKEIVTLFHKESSGHDIYHLRRTLNIALVLQEAEGGDRLIIAVSSLLHDVHRIIQNETGKFCSPKDSLPRVREILDKTDLKEEEKEKILHCVEYHEQYDFSGDGKTVNDLETLILQDADNLEAIGAIGIGRTFMFHGSRGDVMWVPEKTFGRKTFDESVQDLTPIHHFKHKLLKLIGNMNTETAKKIAVGRHQFMELFLEQFFNEWVGKR